MGHFVSLSILQNVRLNINSNDMKIKSPFTGGDVELVTELRKATFRKEEFEYTHLCYKCVDTNEMFTTTEMDTVNTAQVFNQYRLKYGIPFADELKPLRQKYALSASKMSLILGFGENQYRLYENGEIPNVANGRVLRSIQSPYSFETFVDAARNVLSEKDYESIRQKISELKKTQYTQEYFVKKSIFGEAVRNKFNGYAKQSVSRLKNVILFFINKFNGVYTTQMNKLLFYTDFASYRNFGEGMTGLAYKAIQFGPVPDRWDKVYSLIDDIHPEIIDFGNGNAGTKLMSDIQYDELCFTEEQLDLLNDVYMTFRKDNATSLSNLSHKEQAWMENQATHSYIDFSYAFMLKAI